MGGGTATRRPAASTKSERAEADCAAPMGRGATATVERLLASLGKLDEVAPHFAPALDIPNGGVLLARLSQLDEQIGDFHRNT